MCPDEGGLHVRERGGSWGLVQEMGWKAAISELGETRVGAVGWNMGLLLRSLCQEGALWLRGFAPGPGEGWASGCVPGRCHSLPFSDVEGPAGPGPPDAPAALRSVCPSAG